MQHIQIFFMLMKDLIYIYLIDIQLYMLQKQCKYTWKYSEKLFPNYGIELALLFGFGFVRENFIRYSCKLDSSQ